MLAGITMSCELCFHTLFEIHRMQMISNPQNLKVISQQCPLICQSAVGRRRWDHHERAKLVSLQGLAAQNHALRDWGKYAVKSG
jgi:hypothetical protein